MSRIEKKFENLRRVNKKAFISFVMAGDPSFEKSFEIISAMPFVGVDIIELGVPFTDPMADGPSIQRAGQRALNSGMTVNRVLLLVEKFRKNDQKTPIILMGYFNPILSFGIDNFLTACKAVGVDGLIVVDLPPEEDNELCIPATKTGLDFIRLATPTSDEARLKSVLRNTTGFLYYVSITGITGSAISQVELITSQVHKIKRMTEIPVCVGFGIKNQETVRELTTIADGVVVGSAIVSQIEKNKSVNEILNFCESLANGTKPIS